VYERAHLRAGEIFKFGAWMTLIAYIANLSIAIPYWSAIGGTLRR
jgi:hypothetical protein